MPLLKLPSRVIVRGLELTPFQLCDKNLSIGI